MKFYIKHIFIGLLLSILGFLAYSVSSSNTYKTSTDFYITFVIVVGVFTVIYVTVMAVNKAIKERND